MNLTSKVSTPKYLIPNQLYPVIYLLHGMGSDEEDIFSLFEDLKEEAILIAIRGPLQRGSGYAYFDVLRIGYPVIESFDSIINELEAYTVQVQKLYPIDPQRQFFAGFSQGAILSMSLAINMGDRLKGIVALHGYIPQHVSSGKIADLENVLIYIAHGQSDEMFSMSIGKLNEAFFRDRSPQVTFNPVPHGHWISDQEKKDTLQWLRVNL
jgi:phospholipase/carboxylesterase